MQHIRAIIFDLDDTLYAERQYAFSGYRAVAKAYADELAAPFDLEASMRALFDTKDRNRVFNAILEACHRPEDQALIDRMIETFRSHTPTITMHEDAQRALQRYCGRMPTGIISDGPLITQSNKVRALGLQDRIDRITLTDEFGRDFWKPHPRAFEEMAAGLRTPHEQCLYIADNPSKDFVAPNALGWATCQIKRPDGIYRDREPAENGRPQITIESLDDLSIFK